MNTEHNTTEVNTILDTAFEGHAIRVFGTAENPLWVRADVGEILDIQNVRQMDLDPQDLVYIKDTSGGQIREMACVTEFGLYELIFRSRTDMAKRFRRWVCEVLREIRLTGHYSTARTPAALEVERAKLRLRAAEHRAEASRLGAVAQRLRLPERPQGWLTIGEYLQVAAPRLREGSRMAFIAALAAALRAEGLPSVPVRCRWRRVVPAWPGETLASIAERLSKQMRYLPLD